MPKRPLEKTFIAKALADLRKIPRTMWRKNMAASIGGIPDIEGVGEGLYFGLEAKRDAKSLPTPLQLHTIEKINYAGGFGRVIHPDNWVEVYDEIVKLIERKRHVHDDVQGTKKRSRTKRTPTPDGV